MFAENPFHRLNKYDWAGALPIFRYALGTTLVMGYAAGFGNELSYIIPVLALNFFAPGAPRLTPKLAAGLVGSLAVACFLAYSFSLNFLAFPIVFVLIYGITLLHLYYSARLNPVFRIWLLVTFLILPLISSYSSKLGALLSLTLVTNTAIATLLGMVVYLLIPRRQAIDHQKQSAPQKKPDSRARFFNALKITVIILPVAILSFTFQWTGSILILIFIAILSLKPQAANFKAGLLMILANLTGGVAAILTFNLLVVVPQYSFFLLLIFLFGLLFGQQVFSGKPTASLYGTAFSTFLLVLGSVTTSDGEVGSKVWTRLLQIGVAVTYTVLASAYLSKIFPGANKENS